MAATTDKNPVSTTTDSLDTSEISSPSDNFHHVRRGEDAGNLSVAESIDGYDAERMRARTALTAEEEKKLLRRIDWHLMPICSLIFMFKNLDSDNAEAGQFPGVLLQMTYWLFLIEAIATILFGVVVWYCMPDFPETASWLTDEEKAFIQARLPVNAPRASEENFKLSEIIESLKDKRLWLFTLIWAFFTVGTSGVRFYQSTVIANLGFTSIATAQILNIPITALGLIVIGVTGVFADNGRLPRPLYPLSFLTIIIACYAVLVVYPSNGAVYAATMIGNAVTAAWFPMMWPWRVQTTSRATGSAFSIGFVNSYGQIGGAIGPQLFRSAYAPKYTLSFAVAMALVGCCMVVTVITWWVTRKTESNTRKLKLARIAAAKKGEAILDDVVDNDLDGRGRA
ncbi:hypothetical protein SLS62_011207 [Diatrype stigma]|uniref:Uncharacterized protein n=1 Tax=Diatrype stigma TaxID=117547 RepID=A0AAN9U7S7_9PEZI